MNSSESRLPSLRDAFAIVFITFAIALGMQLLAFFIQGKWNMLLAEIFLVLPAMGLVLLKRFPFQQVFRWRRTDFRLLLAGGWMGLGMSVVSDELDRVIQKTIPMPTEIVNALESLLHFRSVGEMVVLVLAVIVIAPVAEEMLFRGLLQGAFERTTDINKAVFSTALIFTFIHFNPWWAVEILIVGVFLGVLAWRCNSIFPCIAMHAVNNAISFIVANTSPKNMNVYLYKDHVAPQWIVLGALLVYLGFKWVYHLTREEFQHD